jgi:hypothetical protein
VSQNFASPPWQSPELVHIAPKLSKVRQYGWVSHVAQVYAESQSLLLAHVRVHVPTVGLPRVAQYEYIALLHGELAVSHASPRPLTAVQALAAFLDIPAAQPHMPLTTTSSGAHGWQPPAVGIALSQMQVLLASSYFIAGPQR